jgi:hypothetical protein
VCRKIKKILTAAIFSAPTVVLNVNSTLVFFLRYFFKIKLFFCSCNRIIASVWKTVPVQKIKTQDLSRDPEHCMKQDDFRIIINL